MRIALTGSSGNVGRSVLVEALHQGYEVVCIDHVEPAVLPTGDHVRFVLAETDDYDALEKAFAGCDALIHLAAIPTPGGHPDHVIHNNNVVGSYNALRAAAENGITRVCQASSVNAIGLAFSRAARFDYFPVDEEHANYCEDPYSLSKWICEQQADSFVRRYENMRIASMRFHWVVPDRAKAGEFHTFDHPQPGKHLWAYTRADEAARACVLSLSADFDGHEAFYIAAPDTCVDKPSLELAKRHFPDVPITGDLSRFRSFFNSSKAERLLGWIHQPGR